jgi:cullin 3
MQALLDARGKYDRLIRLALDNNKHFQYTLNQAFESFVNLNPRSPEFISLFVDDKLRKGLKGLNEEEAEQVLDQVMTLFRYLQVLFLSLSSE